jgi:hypothetical protein
VTVVVTTPRFLMAEPPDRGARCRFFNSCVRICASRRPLACLFAIFAFRLCGSVAVAGEVGGWRLQAGSGVGAQYGVVGVSAEARYEWRHVGLSAGLGGPLVPSATLGLWLPGERFSMGLLAHGGFQPMATSCGTDPASNPKTECHLALAGANLALDHDVGERNGLVLRYGLGLTLIGSGGAGIFLPFTFGLAWQW